MKLYRPTSVSLYIALGGVMMKYVFIYLGLVFLIFAGYQNCADKSFSGQTGGESSDGGIDTIPGTGTDAGNIAGGGSSGGSSGGVGGTTGGSTGGSISSPVLEQQVTQTKINCDNARQKNQLRLLNQKIVFADTEIETGRSQVCLFNTGLNLGMRNEHMQARYEQYQKLNLPANAVVCDLNMSTPLQRFKYDDVFVFTFNNRILATNNKNALFQTTPENTISIMNAGNVSIYNYNWLSLREKTFRNVADDYCLGQNQGAASCRWPVTEQTGQIQFDFDEQLLIALGLRAPSDQQTFGFIITGDDNPEIDCYHERLEFDMNVEYYIK
jgi:hypothetical protein